MARADYAFPFSIDPVSNEAARSSYADHVDQLIRQVLLTAPGERADLPEFGCGLRNLLFAPHSDALQVTTQLMVQGAIDRWLANQVDLQSCVVGPGPGGDMAQLTVTISYVLIETRTLQQGVVVVS